jgi:hypothetical protein
LTVVLCLSVLVAAQQPATKVDASQVLAGAREALGGEARLAGVKNFVATGRTRQVRGDNLLPIEFEIVCELPDKFVRKDEIPAQESGPTSTGFNGEDLIQLPVPAAPPAGGPPRGAPPGAAPSGGPPPGAPGRGPQGPPPGARTATIKQDFVRLTLGMFATSFPSYPLTFAHVGLAEAPQGEADVLDVKGPGTFAVRYFIDRKTHLPIMVSWQVPATNVIVAMPGQPPPTPPPGAIVVDAPPPPAATASKEEQDAYGQAVAGLRKKALAEAKPIENRVYYSDYRAVDGVQFPFRLRRAVAGQTIEETTFDRFRLNTKIDPRRFEVRK